MKPIHSIAVVALLLLSACSSSHRPVYSGHQESTEGVPGFKNGKKMSPHVKLGQSYSVDGETYVPRLQKDYKEEGLASWYGPGFHGGKTANGERFDAEEMTAAHRTLPLPSMVRVTLLETGKSAIVRVNDRGPFSKGRIIDLSRAAAKEIGLIAKGVGRVRVEYLPQESERFAALLAQGRDPKSIDVAQEVLPYAEKKYADADAGKSSWMSAVNPVRSASAAVPQETNDAVDVMEVTSHDLDAPVAAAPVAAAAAPRAAPKDVKDASPFAALQEAEYTAPTAEKVSEEVAAGAGHYLQLGAFANKINATKMQSKVMQIGKAFVEPKAAPDSGTLYLVRMGPYTDVDESARVLAQLERLGINPKTVLK